MRRIALIVFGALVLVGVMLGMMRLIRELFGAHPPTAAVALVLPLVPAVGALLVRWPGLSWRQLVAAVLLACLAVALAAGRILPAYGLDLGTYPGVLADQVRQVVVATIVVSCGVFVLPLIDQRTRRKGPAPRRRLVALATVAVTGLLVLIEWAGVARWGGFGHGTFGLGTLAAGSIVGVILVGSGLLLTIVGRVRQGAWLGALGVGVGCAAILVWLAAGAKWYP